MIDNQFGTLFIVATPIGNLDDISQRALDTLKAVEVIACEDTRITRRLLNRFEIDTKTLRYDEHSHKRAAEKILDIITMGVDVALVSNAGTPTISDPGARLVEEVRRRGVDVISIPGSSAVITALSLSGFFIDKFVFLGFLPKKKGKRTTLLKSISELEMPVVIFLPPRSLKARLSEMVEVLGDRPGCLCRELTKYYETVISGSLSEIMESIRDEEKGELTLVIDLKGR